MRDIILEEIQRIIQTNAAPLIAVDGRCAAGKTTLAAQLQKDLGCDVIHMDDFFLRPEQRTEERLRQPGGNIDWERFREEVLTPFRQGAPFSYRPYDCQVQTFVSRFRLYQTGSPWWRALIAVTRNYGAITTCISSYPFHRTSNCAAFGQEMGMTKRGFFSKNGFRWKNGIFRHSKSTKGVSFVLMKNVGEIVPNI